MKQLVAVFFIVLSCNLSANDDVQFEACRQKLIVAQKLNVLHDLDWKKGSAPKVVAGPTFFGYS